MASSQFTSQQLAMNQEVNDHMWNRNRTKWSKKKLMQLAQKPSVIRNADTGEEYSAPCMNLNVQKTAPRPQPEYVEYGKQRYRDIPMKDLRNS